MSENNQLVRSYSDLLDLLKRDGVPHEANPDDSELVIPTERGPLDSVLLIRWQQDAGVVQMIQPLTFEVPPERIAAMETALCRLNPALVVAGFEIAYERRRVGFRTTLPLQPRGGLLPEEIQTYFRIVVKTAADFLPTLGRIALGLGNPLSVLEDAQADLAGGQAGGPGALGTY